LKNGQKALPVISDKVGRRQYHELLAEVLLRFRRGNDCISDQAVHVPAVRRVRQREAIK
jgi:hypothetical protein